jgi:hypothetical protein
MYDVPDSVDLCHYFLKTLMPLIEVAIDNRESSCELLHNIQAYQHQVQTAMIEIHTNPNSNLLTIPNQETILKICLNQSQQALNLIAQQCQVFASFAHINICYCCHRIHIYATNRFCLPHCMYQ